MRRLLALCSLISLFCVVVHGQEAKRYEAFGGFSYLHASGTEYTTGWINFPGRPFDTNQRGWIGAFSYRPFKYVEFVGEVSGNYDGRGATSLDVPTMPAPGAGGISLSTDTKERTYTYLGGPRVRGHFGRFSPFAHVLLGAAQRNFKRSFGVNAYLPGCHDVGCDTGLNPFVRDFSDTSFAWGVGGGLDLDVTPSISLRLLQADYIRTGFLDSGQNNGRYSTGIVIRF